MKATPRSRTTRATSWASWWAEAANVDDLASLPNRDAQRLLDAYRDLTVNSPSTKSQYPAGADDLGDEGAFLRTVMQSEKSLVAFGEPTRDEILSEVVARAHAVIRPLFTGRPSAPLKAPVHSKSFSLTPHGEIRVVAAFAPGSTAADVALWDLLEAGRRFPIGQCPQCHRYFERKGVRRFCSVRCSSRHHDAERSGTPKRRETVRRAVQTWRDNQAKRAKSKQPRRRKGN